MVLETEINVQTSEFHIDVRFSQFIFFSKKTR